MQRDFDFLEAGVQYVRKSSNLRQTIQELVRFAAAAAGSDMGSFYIVDRARNVLVPYAIVGLPAEYVAACTEVPVGTQCCGRAVLHKMPWVVEDMLTDPLFAENRKAAEQSPIRAAFSVPVVDARGECIGSLASHFAHPYTPGPFAIERNRLFAQLIAVAFAKDEEQNAMAALASD